MAVCVMLMLRGEARRWVRQERGERKGEESRREKHGEMKRGEGEERLRRGEVRQRREPFVISSYRGNEIFELSAHAEFPQQSELTSRELVNTPWKCYDVMRGIQVIEDVQPESSNVYPYPMEMLLSYLDAANACLFTADDCRLRHSKKHSFENVIPVITGFVSNRDYWAQDPDGTMIGAHRPYLSCL
ncbi:hypothetical protein EAI_02824 [Harpegnathos saltator]|uniref:Uncharacterized protein n=1 Tax=Harpegnathos saltator TaxID=610380 RepID=E2C6P0_HARSA|nr:hypothetical protein EAI_02824 [Harpegnathos saltator]